jgi:hypothetical protein
VRLRVGQAGRKGAKGLSLFLAVSRFSNADFGILSTLSKFGFFRFPFSCFNVLDPTASDIESNFLNSSPSFISSPFVN